MTTIRDLFHEVGNWHNKISVGAGVARMELKEGFPTDTPAEIEKALKRFNELEQHAIEAGKTLQELKKIIYGRFDPDTGKPKE